MCFKTRGIFIFFTEGMYHFLVHFCAIWTISHISFWVSPLWFLAPRIYVHCGARTVYKVGGVLVKLCVFSADGSYKAPMTQCPGIAICPIIYIFCFMCTETNRGKGCFLFMCRRNQKTRRTCSSVVSVKGSNLLAPTTVDSVAGIINYWCLS